MIAHDIRHPGTSRWIPTPGFGGGPIRAGGERRVIGGVAQDAARHVPVLAHAAIDYLNLREGGVYIDGTFGAGGYSRMILNAANAKVIGIDRDESAVARGFDLVES